MPLSNVLAGWQQSWPPRLIVVGGLSGTGKTTLAAALAPTLGGAPGALHLRTDLERKWLAGVEEFQQLPPEAYSKEASADVFERIYQRARMALAAGHSVIIDGVFADPLERATVKTSPKRQARGSTAYGWKHQPLF